MKCPVCHGELQGSSSFCPYCGTRLDWTGSTRTSSSPSKHIGAAIGLIVLLVAGGLFPPRILIPPGARFVDDSRGGFRNPPFPQSPSTKPPLPHTPGKAP